MDRRRKPTVQDGCQQTTTLAIFSRLSSLFVTTTIPYLAYLVLSLTDNVIEQ